MVIGFVLVMNFYYFKNFLSSLVFIQTDIMQENI